MSENEQLEAEMLQAALEVAGRAGRRYVEALTGDESIGAEKKSAFDIVTKIDRELEAMIVGFLQERFPEHSVLAEEGGAQQGAGDYCWVVDPLDGTNNFAHGLPWSSISIAAMRGDEPVVGVVLEPLRNDMFSARKGRGAYLNGERIAVAEETALADVLVATGFPFRHKDRLQEYLRALERVFRHIQGIRRMGSAALDLAGVACGRFGGYFELGLSRWDIAAGVLLVREAGGVVTGFGADPDFWSSGNLLASNGTLHGKLREELDAVFGAPPRS